MGIDMVNFFGAESGTLQGNLYGSDSALSVWCRLGEVESIAVGAVAGKFSQDRGSALEGIIGIFKDHNGGTFAHDKAVPFSIEGAAGCLRIFVLC